MRYHCFPKSYLSTIPSFNLGCNNINVGKVKQSFGIKTVDLFQFGYRQVALQLMTSRHSFLIIFSDISALKSAETQLERLSNYDNLTNLPNRSLFFDRLSSAIERSGRANNKTALFFINIDRF